MRLHTVYFALAALLPAAVQAQTPKPLAIPEPVEAVAELCTAITDTMADSAEALQEKLGKADKVEKISLPNRHNPKTNDLRVMYHYQDGLVSLYTVPSLKLTYMEAAVLTSKFWPEPIPNYIDTSRKALKKQFGKPDEEDEERVVYLCSYETNDSLNFLMKEDKVYRLVLRHIIE
ncbi:MAG: hypothetical protein HUJ29_13320 [Gammaproteobacteria bacterium]|nr:hypothetical protein [Gammaproteobacteria bacterium]